MYWAGWQPASQPASPVCAFPQIKYFIGFSSRNHWKYQEKLGNTCKLSSWGRADSSFPGSYLNKTTGYPTKSYETIEITAPL